MQGKQALFTYVVNVPLFAVLASLWPVSAQETDILDDLPRSWDTQGTAKYFQPCGKNSPVCLYILAWMVIEDDRPLRVESCLVLKVRDKGEGYWLGHLCRRPADKEPEWRLSTTYVIDGQETKYFRDRCITHAKIFKDKPSNKQLYDALKFEEVNWSFKQEKGWKFVSCGVCEKSWKQAIGEKPNQFFGQ